MPEQPQPSHLPPLYSMAALPIQAAAAPKSGGAPWWAWPLTALILVAGLLAAAWIHRPVPAPAPPSNSKVEAAAEAYMYGFPQAFRSVAKDVRLGKTDKAAIDDALSEALNGVGTDMTTALTDAPNLATALEAAADAMDGVLKEK